LKKILYLRNRSDFYEFYSNLNSIKKENNLLDIDSEIKFKIIETNNKNLICYKRTKNNDSMYFMANLSEESQEINTEFSETLKSLNSNKMISLKKNSLDPWEYHFLK
jgi:alpha-amylase